MHPPDLRKRPFTLQSFPGAGLRLEAVTGSELMPGVIAAIQTFGTRINLHPHLHFLVTEGGVD